MERIIIKANANVVYEISNTGMLKANTLMEQIKAFPGMELKKDNVMPSLENFLFKGREITKAEYDMLTNEIHLYISDFDYKICPRCGKGYSTYSAISRLDNKTEICPDCGTEEALNEFYKNQK